MKTTRILLGALWLSACAAPPPPILPQAAPKTPGLLGPGDIFEVRVYGEKELSGIYRVSVEGTIDFPLVGRIRVESVTAADLSEIVAAELERYVKAPNVSIFVKEYNSQKIYVFGQVQRPGTFKYETGMNIVQAITLAGGFGRMADQSGAFVTRIIDGREQRLKVSVEDIGEGRSPNLELEPGDIVYVPEALF